MPFQNQTRITTAKEILFFWGGAGSDGLGEALTLLAKQLFQSKRW